MKRFLTRIKSGIRATGSFWGLLIIAGLLLFTRLLFDEPFFLYTFYVVVIYLLVSFLYIYFSLDRIEIERKSRSHRRQVGDLFEENLILSNRSILPIFWMKVRDLSEINRYKLNRVIGFLGARQMRMIRFNNILQNRGNIILSPVEIFTSDPLGCFFSSKRIDTEGSLIVLPYRVDLSTTRIKNRPSEEGRSARMAIQHNTIISGAVRPYLDGDPFKSIHWPTTARRNSLYTKQPDMNLQQRVWICMDCDRKDHVRRRISAEQEYMDFLDAANLHRKYVLPPDTMETVVSITSSLAVTWLKKGVSVGLSMNNPKNRLIQPGSGTRQQSDILNVLTYVQADSSIPFAGMLLDMAGQISSGVICFFVTPEASPEIGQAAYRMQRTGVDVRIIHVNRESYVPELIRSEHYSEWKSIRWIQFNYGDPLSVISSIV